MQSARQRNPHVIAHFMIRVSNVSIAVLTTPVIRLRKSLWRLAARTA